MDCTERSPLLGLFPLKRIAVPVMMISGPTDQAEPAHPSRHQLATRYIR